MGALFVLILLGFIIFAALAWFMVSSCMGHSLLEGIREFWNMLLLSAQTEGRPTQWVGRNRGFHDPSEMFEMELRGRGRAA